MGFHITLGIHIRAGITLLFRITYICIVLLIQNPMYPTGSTGEWLYIHRYKVSQKQRVGKNRQHYFSQSLQQTEVLSSDVQITGTFTFLSQGHLCTSHRHGELWASQRFGWAETQSFGLFVVLQGSQQHNKQWLFVFSTPTHPLVLSSPLQEGGTQNLTSPFCGIWR